MFNFLPHNRLHKHFLFWLGIALYFFILHSIYPDYKETVGAYYPDFDYQHSPFFVPIFFFIVLAVAALYAYSFRFLVIPLFLKNKYWQSVLLFIAITAGISYTYKILMGIEFAVIDPMLRGKPMKTFDFTILQGFFLHEIYIFEYSMIIFLVAFYKFLEIWTNKEQESSRLEQEKLQTDLQLFKARIQPHFLFNTLNNLYSLTLQKSRQSPEVVLKLSHLLSYMLYESQAETVPLEKELEMLKNYVALEQIRMQGDLEVSLNIVGEIKDKKIAPLLLFPFIENAFNYNFDKKEEINWVSVHIHILENTLKFKLIHSKNEYNSTNYMESSTIQNISKRLNLLYPNHFELKITSEENIYLVNFVLQLIEIHVFDNEFV